jgi:hypothetical protein
MFAAPTICPDAVLGAAVVLGKMMSPVPPKIATLAPVPWMIVYLPAIALTTKPSALPPVIVSAAAPRTVWLAALQCSRRR